MTCWAAGLSCGSRCVRDCSSAQHFGFSSFRYGCQLSLDLCRPDRAWSLPEAGRQRSVTAAPGGGREQPGPLQTFANPCG